MRTPRMLLLSSVAMMIGIASAPLCVAADGDSRPATSVGAPLLTGFVKSQSGEPMSGVTVSTKRSGTSVTVSVYTDENGAYYFPPLNAAGHYAVWAQAQGYERDDAAIDAGKGISRANFKLVPTDHYLEQLSGWDEARALPDDTVAERRGKTILVKVCTGCHQSSKVAAVRFDTVGWERLIEAMAHAVSSNAPLNGNIVLWKKELVAYLTTVSGPEGTRPKLKDPLPRPTGEAALPVIYEYDIPGSDGKLPFSNGSDWSKGVPSISGRGAGLHDATVDLDGNIWFSSPFNVPGRTIGKIDGITGQTTSFAYPAEGGATASAHGMITAGDGTIWFTMVYGRELLKDHLGFMNPKTLEQHFYPVAADMPALGGWLNRDGLGNIWAAAGSYGGGGALRFDRKTSQFHYCKPLTMTMTYGVAGDAMGNGWFAQINNDSLGYCDPVTGKVEEIPLPPREPLLPYLQKGDFTDTELKSLFGAGLVGDGAPGVKGAPVAARQMPRRVIADLKTGDIWVPNWAGNTLLRVNSKTRDMTYFPMPYPGMNPYTAGVDRQSRVWVGLQNGDEVARFDPQTTKWTIYYLPTKGVSARDLNVVERDGTTEVILPANDSDKVIRMVIRSSQDVEKLKSAFVK